ncbi:MAG: alpha/beta hydrolase family protein [Polyangiaceae bacterium]
MRQFGVMSVLLLALLACKESETKRDEATEAPPDTKGAPTLAEARKGFVTKLEGPVEREDGPVAPPQAPFTVVKYTSKVGELEAYVTADPGDGKQHPAILWITGGDYGSIGDVWSERQRDNDQSAAQYRKAGLVMMFPSMRGGNENPGRPEGFFGEVDDVIAAADVLAKQPYVDPKRVYLGGHSTGGTLALLVAECTDRFRAVISFGPVEDPRGYGQPKWAPYSAENPSEWRLRAPSIWLHGVKSPTFVIEGAKGGNIESLEYMQKRTTNPALHFIPVANATHFSVLAPANEVVAKKLMADTGETPNISITSAELDALFK